MAVHLVIDGYNVTMRRPPAGAGGVTDIEGDRELLISQLQSYKRVRKVKVTVVFDAAGAPGLARGGENRGGVSVVYSASGQEADAVIRSMAREKREGATIVTSDAALAGYVRNVGAVVLSSTEFEDLLQMALYQEMKGVDPDDEDDDGPGRGGGGGKKGPAERAPKEARKKRKRMKKL